MSEPDHAKNSGKVLLIQLSYEKWMRNLMNLHTWPGADVTLVCVYMNCHEYSVCVCGRKWSFFNTLFHKQPFLCVFISARAQMSDTRRSPSLRLYKQKRLNVTSKCNAPAAGRSFAGAAVAVMSLQLDHRGYGKKWSRKQVVISRQGTYQTTHVNDTHSSLRYWQPISQPSESLLHKSREGEKILKASVNLIEF